MLPETFQKAIVTERVRRQSIKTRITDLNRGDGKTFEIFVSKASEGYSELKLRNSKIARAADEELPEDFQSFLSKASILCNKTTQNYKGKAFLIY